MSKQAASQFQAGLFILVSIGLAVVTFFAIAGSSVALGPTLHYDVRFSLNDDVGGLKAGSDVRVGGVRVGSVTEVRIDTESSPAGVVTRIRVPQQYALREGAVVEVQLGLTGIVNLNITDLGPKDAPAPQDAIVGRAAPLSRAISGLAQAAPEANALIHDLRTRTVPTVEQAFVQGTTTLADAEKTSIQFRTAAESADELVRHVRSQVDPVIARYNTVADGAARALVEVESLLGDTKTDLRTTIANLQSASSEFDKRLPGLMDGAGATVESVNSAVNEIRGMLDEVETTLLNASEISTDVRGLVARNESRMDEILMNLTAGSQTAAAALSEIRRSPWRLLYRPSDREVANQNLYDATRQFAEGARRLQNAASSLRDLANDPQATPDQINTKLDELRESFEKFEAFESTLWRAVQQ